jgi:hypothetical protein
MITIDKVKEYEAYRGYYDGYYLQKVQTGENLMFDGEWALLNNFILDLQLVLKGLAAKQFADRLYINLNENCDSEETIEYLKFVVTKWYL